MDQESLKSILILGRLPLRMLGIEHVHRFLIGPRFRIQKGLIFDIWGGELMIFKHVNNLKICCLGSGFFLNSNRCKRVFGIKVPCQKSFCNS